MHDLFRYSLFIMSLDVTVRKGEPVERALRRLKKRLDREGVIRDVALSVISRSHRKLKT